MITLNTNSTNAFLQALKNRDLLNGVGAPKQETQAEAKSSVDSTEFAAAQKINAAHFVQNAKSANDAIGYLQVGDSTYKKVQKELGNLELVSTALSDETLDAESRDSLKKDGEEILGRINELQKSAKFMDNILIGKSIVYESARINTSLEFFDASGINIDDVGSVVQFGKKVADKREEIKTALTKISQGAEDESTKSVGAASAFDFSKIDPNIFKNLTRGF